MSPKSEIITQAVRVASWSPCQKSKRGIVVFDDQDRVKGWGYNSAPIVLGSPSFAFACDGSSSCRTLCSQRCIHAEMRALDDIYVDGDDESPFFMLHVKVEDGLLVAGGPPSCIPCASALLERGIISGMWLYEIPGEWRYYPMREFYDLSIKNGGK